MTESNGKTRAQELMESNKLVSRSESLSNRRIALSGIPEISNRMARSVSEFRRDIMESQLESGEMREKGSGFVAARNRDEIRHVQTPMGLASHNGKGLYKMAQSAASGSGSGWRGPNNTMKQVPEVYSPIWLNSNLSLPRDRVTINAWCRAFFALNPIVHNAITLHSTYPISKLNIKCKNQKAEKFFSQMAEEIDLMNVAVMAAQEYWVLGEAIIYGDLDESKGTWSNLTILNPDYVNIQRSVIAGEPIISLRPDESLRRVIFSNQPADIQQRQQLNPAVIEHVRRNENIPLNNIYVHHMARRIAPYETRGTGLIVSCFRALMLFDKLRESKYAQADGMVNPLTLVKIGNQDSRPTPTDLDHWRNVFECYDDNTEVLTNDGFKYFKDTIDYIDNNGVITSKPKDGIKIGCYNAESKKLEFLLPEKSYVNNYTGDMYHFHNNKIDIKVTPDHDMWVSEKEYKYNPKRFSWSDYKKKKAKDLNMNDYNKFCSVLNWEGESVDFVKINGHDVDINIYLEFMGYVLSEGCCYTNNKFQNTVSISQKKYIDKMYLCLSNIATKLDIGFGSRIDGDGVWVGVLSGKGIYEHFINQIGQNRSTYSWEKNIPEWIRNLKSKQLKILLDAMIVGDGSFHNNKDGTWHKTYWTSSKLLADNVQEIALKCGYSVVLNKKHDKRDNRRLMYYVQWSNSENGNYPLVYKKSRNSQTKQWNSTFDVEKYNGKIWCFTVPTGLFVTRRNGKITIQGNSAQNDKDFKIFTHDAVQVERVGYGQGIYDTSADITQLIKEIYIGLMVPSVIMDGSDTTYATGSVALDVLRQRYMQFRQMMTGWLRRKIFAPISQINDFYEYAPGGEKTLIVPEIDWNHMSLFDMDSYINQMVQLTQGEGVQKRASLQTMYRSLGLEYEEEQRKIRYEDIQDAIRVREIQALGKYKLNELKALGPGNEIDEPLDEPVPGQSPYVVPQGGTGGVDNGSGGGLGGSAPMPGLGPMPGTPPSAPMGAKPPA